MWILYDIAALASVICIWPTNLLNIHDECRNSTFICGILQTYPELASVMLVGLANNWFISEIVFAVKVGIDSLMRECCE